MKGHQLAESSAQVLLMNVPPVLDRGSIKGEIIWHLTEIEKGLLKKGVLPSEYVGVQLPKIRLDLATEQTGEREKQSGERPLSQQATRLSRKWMSCLYRGGCGGFLAKTGAPLGSVPQNGVMLVGTRLLLPYGCHVQQEGN